MSESDNHAESVTHDNTTEPTPVPEATPVHKDPKFISALDIERIIKILSGADKISTEEAVARLNRMVAKGSLVIVPPFGVKRKM